MATIPAGTKLNDRGEAFDASVVIWQTLKILGSLKLAVTLFALSLVLVLVGTLAQDELNMLAVKNRYFVTWFAWLYIDDFFPQAFYRHDEPFRLRLPFLGGKAIGVLLFINLVAAKATRFKVSARGGQLTGGLVLLAIGTLLTMLIVFAGHSGDGLQGTPPQWLGYRNLWLLTLASGIALSGALLMTGFRHANPLARRFALASGAIVGFFVLKGIFGGQIDDPGLRIIWQLAKGLGAGVFLLAGCMLVFGRQGGNLLLHFGVALLMFGQFVFGDRQLEQRLSLVEGQSSNVLVNLDQIELKFAQMVGDTEQITAVPASLLQRKKGQTISSDRLPVDVRVDAYYQHSRLVKPVGLNRADTGIGLNMMAIELPINGGTDGESNVPSAYITLIDKSSEKPMGTYLVSQWNSDRKALDPSQADNLVDTVSVGDIAYTLGLGFHREVKPYWVQLNDVQRIDYSGSSTPKDYSSHVRIVDNETGADRKDRIWMNNPLRYRGETFYQASYSALPGGKEWTSLQVVRNSGWLIPYVACSITALGMLAHFLGTLGRFLNRRTRETKNIAGQRSRDRYADGDLDVDAMIAEGQKSDVVPPPPSAGLIGRYWPIIFSAASATLMAVMFLVPWDAVANTMRPRDRSQSYDWYQAGKIPVQSGGRVMPLDAYARQTLKSISNRESLKVDEYTPAEIRSRTGGAKSISAIQWLMEVAIDEPAIGELRMIRIDAEEVRSELELERRKSKLYSIAEIQPGIMTVRPQLEKIRAKDRKLRDFKEQKLIELDLRMQNYTLANVAFSLPAPRPIPMAEFKKFMPNATESDRQIFSLRQLQQRLETLEKMTSARLIVPTKDVAAEAVADEKIDDPDWRPFSAAFFDHFRKMAIGEASDPPNGMQSFADMIAAYGSETGDPNAFNQAVDAHLAAVQEYEIPGYKEDLVGMERWMQTASPSYSSIYIYLMGLVMGLVYLMLGWSRLRWSVTAFLIVGFIVHTLAIYCRMEVTGRAPVINLYSSAVFIGWAAVLGGLIIEGIFKVGIGNLLAAFSGVASLLVAYGITYTTGDTMPVLQAVLDTQFWLATHVITVTLGYVATMVAGFLGIGYLLTHWIGDLRKPSEDGQPHFKEFKRTLYRCIYGSACFGILFSFVGTVLGGLWADDSWGRFWGWDPKENGALLIVIWNAIMLHARWDAMVGPRGFASLAIGGNIVTAWSWFGTNELGIGLHSYGFTEGVLKWLSIFVVTQLAVMAIDGLMRLLPRRRPESTLPA